MGNMLIERAEHVLLTEDEDVIEALAPYATEIALTCPIRSRCPIRRAQDSDACAPGDTIELNAELVVVVTTEEPRALAEWCGVA